MIGKSIAHYEILARLGEGGMGEVYRARDRKLGRDVALKVLSSDLAKDPTRLGRFEREARTVASLKHPNIVTLFAIEESDDLHFFTMELVEGSTLGDLLPPLGFALDRFYPLAIALADALSAAHASGVTHRDLKPANIMIDNAGLLKILDFGLAKPSESASMSADQHEDPISRDGLVLGTLPYMSPEQVEGLELDARSDVFSLGVLFYEMLAGQRPFSGRTPAALISSILRDRPRPITDFRADASPGLDALIEECLEKSPRERPASAEALKERLAALYAAPARPHTPRSHSIAVLPFTDMSPQNDQEYLCEGIVEELVNGLAQIENLAVASRSSARLYKEWPVDAREIGRRLKVEHILEGSVRKSGERLRVSAKLVKAADGFQLWSEQYDRQIEDLFAIQEEIAGKIIRSLRVTLAPEQMPDFHRSATSDMQAYDYYLRGRNFYYQFRRRDIDLALRMYTLAIQHDPGFALAYAGIADCWSYLFLYAEMTRPSLDQAEAASQKALSLDPKLPEAHASRGQVLSLKRQHAEAQAAFEKALILGPQLYEAHYFYARDCFAQGLLQKAAGLFEQAAALRPEDYQAPLLVAQIYDSLGRPEQAASSRRRGVKIAEERLRVNAGDVRALYMGANGLMVLGERVRSLEWAALALGIEPDDSMVLYNVGCIFALGGESDKALDCLERAVSAGLAQKGWYEHDSNLDSLRELPRFQTLMQRLEAIIS